MAKIFVIGKITDEVELKYSENNVPYVRFTLMEIMSNGAKPQFYQVWAWYKDAEDLKKFKVHKNSVIELTGTLQLETFMKSDGKTQDKRLKVIMDSWNFISKKILKTEEKVSE